MNLESTYIQPKVNHTCSFCTGFNHFARVCLKKNPKQKSSNGCYWEERTKSFKKLEETSEDTDSEDGGDDGENDFKIFELKDKDLNRRKTRVELKFKFDHEWKNVVCNLDTYSNAHSTCNKTKILCFIIFSSKCISWTFAIILV